MILDLEYIVTCERLGATRSDGVTTDWISQDKRMDEDVKGDGRGEQIGLNDDHGGPLHAHTYEEYCPSWSCKTRSEPTQCGRIDIHQLSASDAVQWNDGNGPS